MRQVKRTALALAVLLAASSANAEDLWTARASAGVGIDAMWLVHDASGISPVLGSPTSILFYDSLVAPQLRLGIESGADAGLFFDADLTMGMGRGTLGDRDYLAGGVLSSDTSSTLATQSLAATLRFWPTAPGDGAFSPYAILAVSRASYDAGGIVCGEVCPSGSLPDDTPVLTLESGAASAGVGWVYQAGHPNENQLRLGVEITLGGTYLLDSHLLRDDLGPQPNIAYGFATLGTAVTAEYRVPLADTLDIVTGGGVSGIVGWGDITYRAGSDPLPAQPAAMLDLSGHLSLGLAGRF